MAIIAVDFDGTCVKHCFPELGEEIGAAPVLKELTDAGHLLILWTMRSNMLTPRGGAIQDITPDTKGHFLNIAIKWFNDHDIPLYGIQTNPEQSTWTESPKAYANYYIDDASINCPLIKGEKMGDRPYVDWVRMRKILVEKHLLSE